METLTETPLSNRPGIALRWGAPRLTLGTVVRPLLVALIVFAFVAFPGSLFGGMILGGFAFVALLARAVLAARPWLELDAESIALCSKRGDPVRMPFKDLEYVVRPPRGEWIPSGLILVARGGDKLLCAAGASRETVDALAGRVLEWARSYGADVREGTPDEALAVQPPPGAAAADAGAIPATTSVANPPGDRVRVVENGDRLVLDIARRGWFNAMIPFGALFAGVGILFAVVSDLELWWFGGIFVTAGLILAVSGLRIVTASYRCTIAGGRLELARSDAFTKRTSATGLLADDPVRREVAYKVNNRPVWRIVAHGAEGDAKFGSDLTDDEQAWIAARIVERAPRAVREHPGSPAHAE